MAPVPSNRLSAEFSDRESAARETAKNLTNGQLVGHNLDDLIELVTKHHALEDADIYMNTMYLEYELHENNQLEISPLEQQVVELRFIVQCSSAARFLEEISGMRISGSDAKTWKIQKSYWVPAMEYESEVLEDYQNRWKKEIAEAVKIHDGWVAEHHARIDRDVRKIIEMKQRIALSIIQDAERLNILLSPSPTAVNIPVKPKTLHLVEVEARAGVGEPARKLADDIANQLVETLRSFAAALERQHKVSAHMLKEGEESLRDILLFILNAQWQGQVTGETFVGNGKTDLLLRYKDVNAFIGECKIWAGSSQFSEAINQLLGYTVWSDTRAGLILFIRGMKDVEGVVKKAAECITKHKNYIRKGMSENEFVVHSKHDSERHIRVSLIPVHIPSSDPLAVETATTATAESGY